ncbi:hypothetical protein HCN44_003720 [Aphidius gifuensis]|uniref:Uncharacterized protein n=1 Tax=Aphidius gifuensis TaxID=684658 RepID=A0A835CL35_APHGI|nr:hypothetical protein HCN44_003720 [Aphidius gifuensis]
MDNTGPFEDSKSNTDQLEIGYLPPNKVDENHQLDSTTNNFVKIISSDHDDNKESTTLPWLNSLAVKSTTSLPLSGIGLYHRGANSSAGIIAYRLYTIDYSLFL